jgi:hypothetical protein
LDRCGSHATMPGANQLWMLVGFSLFRGLRAKRECLEVFPQATACVLGSSAVHKSDQGGFLAQLTSVARHTGWPAPVTTSSLRSVGYGSRHDRLDAYMSAWVASLDETAREPLGDLPNDVIWIPRIEGAGVRPVTR